METIQIFKDQIFKLLLRQVEVKVVMEQDQELTLMQERGSEGGSGGGGGARCAPTQECNSAGGSSTASFMIQGNSGGQSANTGPTGQGGAVAVVQRSRFSRSLIKCWWKWWSWIHNWPGDSTLRAGGGGGSGANSSGTGGPGGGGNGSAPGSGCRQDGTANTGGGGGGGANPEQGAGGAGGSGVVIIQYPGPQRAGGGTISCVSCKTQHLFSVQEHLQQVDHIYQPNIY